MSDQSSGRILLLTFPKCGSQWVRDVLFSEELAAANGVPQGVSDHRLGGAWGIPDFEPGTISGPIYGASARKWREFTRLGDKAVVLLRDPRDVVISWMFAALYSHEPVRPLDTYRECLRTMSPASRVLLAVDSVGRQHSEAFCSWAERRSNPTLHITTYERLLGDQAAGFREIVDFLGWSVSDSALSAVLDRLSFEKRSGRAPGEEDQSSYYRKATPGDWSNHFNRLSGQLLEVLLPGVVVALGYESSPEWYQALPASAPSQPSGRGSGAEEATALRLRQAEAAVARLQRIADERQGVIDELSTEAQARLRVIEELQQALDRST